MSFILQELSLIIPTKNDHIRINDNLKDIIDYLESKIKNFEILIVSNNSSKQSIEYLEALSTYNTFINHMSIKEGGKGIAIRKGIEKSKFTNILFTDADCSVKISEFDKFTINGNLKSPFVIGNRKNKLSENLNSPLLRKLSGYCYLYINKKLFNLGIEDTQCGFKAIDKKKFKNCDNFKTDGFSFDIELILLALESGIDIIEIPVKYVHNSNSKVNVFSQTIRMFYEILLIKKRF